jgi:hypothetical protein
MPETTADLNAFIARVQKANNAREVLKILDEFRPLPWNDDDRANMAKAYVKVLERVGAPTQDESAHEEVEANDGPVWYEKM